LVQPQRNKAASQAPPWCGVHLGEWLCATTL